MHVTKVWRSRQSRRLTLVRRLLLCVSVALVVSCGGGAGQAGGAGGGPQQSWDFFRIVNASVAPVTIQYAYAPSIVLKNGVYHAFFCSGGNIFPAWDYVRYVKSTDGGNTWSDPVDMLHATAFNGMDLSACDPSVVYFQGFYYMYYGAAITTAPNMFQTVIQVARASAVDGPYLTYTQRGTWEDTPNDPQVIIKPLVTRSQFPTGYGAGQPSVVVLNGKLLMWYTDDSEQAGPPGDFEAFRLYMLESSDPVTWTPDATSQTNIYGADSPDVKYDATGNRFVVTWVSGMFTSSASLTRAFSSDGLTWGPIESVIGAGAFPPFTHNAGASADEAGQLLPSKTLVGFGAPYNLAHVNSLGNWDLYGVVVDSP
jgi:beta-xylosidase